MKNFFTLTLCVFTLSLTAQEAGCTYPQADNFSPTAIVDDGTCVFGSGLCGEGTMWNSELELCEITNPTDSNFDGCTGLSDLLNLLSIYGDCSESNSCGNPFNYQGYGYSTVQIGAQCWFAENLRSAYFVNGESIPNEDPNDWSNYETPAYTYYTLDNDTIGYFYNWWAAHWSNEVCPNLWHTPTKLDYEILFDAVGGQDVAGGYLKEVGYESWVEPNLGASDFYSFSALPNGILNNGSQSYDDLGYKCWLWTSDEYTSNSILGFGVTFKHDQIDGGFPAIDKRDGMAIRCIKD